MEAQGIENKEIRVEWTLVFRITFCTVDLM